MALILWCREILAPAAGQQTDAAERYLPVSCQNRPVNFLQDAAAGGIIRLFQLGRERPKPGKESLG